jgi:hypothetical protein
MKKILLSILPAIFFAQSLFAQTVYIPDAAFKSYLVGNKAINTNGDGEIQKYEAFTYDGSINAFEEGIESLIGIEAFPYITALNCFNNQLTSLDISKNTALKTLHCSDNKITSINLSKNVTLERIYLGNNQLTSIDVTKNIALKSLGCGQNQLTSIDVSKNIALETLEFGQNQLTSIDVSKNIALGWLACYKNQFTNIDVSKNIALRTFYCGENQLKNLDITKNVALKWLICKSNQLISLDFSKNIALVDLDCSSNKLKSLNLKNGNNSLISTCDATQNPSLSCIQVDDTNNIPTAWKKDATAKYSAQCNYVSTNDALTTTNMTLYPNPTSSSLSLRWEGEIASVQFELFNAQGALVQSQNIDNQGSINVGNLPKGLYLCQIKDANKVIQTSKVIIE